MAGRDQKDQKQRQRIYEEGQKAEKKNPSFTLEKVHWDIQVICTKTAHALSKNWKHIIKIINMINLISFRSLMYHGDWLEKH